MSAFLQALADTILLSVSVSLVTLHTKYKWDHAVCFSVISMYHLMSLRFIHVAYVITSFLFTVG